MRRQVDHHLARARAIGRRASLHARATVWESLEAVERAVARLYSEVTVDIAGDREARSGSSARTSTRCSAIWSRMPRNTAMAACSSPSSRSPTRASRSWSRTTGRASPQEREAIFARGARLEHRQAGHRPRPRHRPRRAEIYGGSVRLEESEDLGGLLARLTLPAGLRLGSLIAALGATRDRTIHPLRRAARRRSTRLVALTGAGMNAVNAVILDRMQSKVALIPSSPGT